MACLLALVAAVAAWAVNSSGGGGGKGSGAPAGSHTPVATITAGPAPTGTHISGRPGGRDTTSGGGTGTDGGTDSGSSDGGTGNGTAGDTAGTTAGSAGSDAAGGSTDGASSAGSSGGSSAGSSGSSGSSGGGELPVGSSLPDCAPGAVQLGLATTQNSYGPGQTPQFKLTATNTSDITCKVDFGPAKAVFTVTQATDDSHVWATDDCPKTGSYLMQVPAHGSTVYALNWNEKTSSPKCASPKGQQAGLDTTYLVAARVAGYGSKQVSFRLSAD